MYTSCRSSPWVIQVHTDYFGLLYIAHETTPFTGKQEKPAKWQLLSEGSRWCMEVLRRITKFLPCCTTMLYNCSINVCGHIYLFPQALTEELRQNDYCDRCTNITLRSETSPSSKWQVHRSKSKVSLGRRTREAKKCVNYDRLQLAIKWCTTDIMYSGIHNIRSIFIAQRIAHDPSQRNMVGATM